MTGIDEREATSPSFFNRAEVQVLMDYVKKLLQTAGKKGLATISPKDIGIITPYRKQVGITLVPCRQITVHIYFWQSVMLRPKQENDCLDTIQWNFYLGFWVQSNSVVVFLCGVLFLCVNGFATFM